MKLFKKIKTKVKQKMQNKAVNLVWKQFAVDLENVLIQVNEGKHPSELIVKGQIGFFKKALMKTFSVSSKTSEPVDEKGVNQLNELINWLEPIASKLEKKENLSVEEKINLENAIKLMEEISNDFG